MATTTYATGAGFAELSTAGIDVFSTCPQSREASSDGYLEDALRVARWSDRAGCRGMLIYTDNALVDPWLLAQNVLQATEQLCPLVAIQPAYMHPYAAAKMVASLGFLHQRRIYLNMVAGGFRNDLLALDDDVPHDERYDRLVEYTRIMVDLLRGDGPVTFKGDYYKVTNLRMKPALPSHLMPPAFVSGSSDAGLAAARALGATAVRYPRPPSEEISKLDDDVIDFGMRVGVITREDGDEAWSVAHELFPACRKGQMTHKLAMKVSDSRWHRQLSELGAHAASKPSPYWLGPFENYKTFCPYLVGSYREVADEIGRYLSLGFRTFILDIPPSPVELSHTAVAFRLAADGID
jgi:alkanesulfonate monooxygenase